MEQTKNEGFYCLYSSTNIIGLIRTREIKWPGDVARLVTGDVHTLFWLGDLRGRDNMKNLGVDGRILFKWIFEKWNEDSGLRLRERKVLSSCECGYETLGFIKYKEFLG
jgi:hypothetical protein